MSRRRQTTATPAPATGRSALRLPGLVAGLAGLLGGCGYTFGSGLHETGVRTVHIQAVANDTYRQRFESELSAAVSRELSASSDLLPAGAKDADAILELRIVDEAERTLVVGDRSAPIREGSQTAFVHMRLRDRRTGRILIDRPVTDRAEFRDPLGEDLTSARQELVEDLARKIVLALETRF